MYYQLWNWKYLSFLSFSCLTCTAWIHYTACSNDVPFIQDMSANWSLCFIHFTAYWQIESIWRTSSPSWQPFARSVGSQHFGLFTLWAPTASPRESPVSGHRGISELLPSELRDSADKGSQTSVDVVEHIEITVNEDMTQGDLPLVFNRVEGCISKWLSLSSKLVIRIVNSRMLLNKGWNENPNSLQV